MQIYKKYATLKMKLNDLEDEMEEVNKEILKDLEKNKQEKIEFKFGKFTYSTRKNYKYSIKVSDLEDRVKLAKHKEQEKGIAKVEETHYLLFTPIK